MEGMTIGEALKGVDWKPYSLVVAIDVIEHVHPDELQGFLETIGRVLGEDGTLFCNVNWGQQDIYPMHYNHSQAFEAWLERNNLEKVSAYEYRKIKSA